MIINDQITLRGQLSITCTAPGSNHQTITEHNMIMTSAKKRAGAPDCRPGQRQKHQPHRLWHQWRGPYAQRPSHKRGIHQGRQRHHVSPQKGKRACLHLERERKRGLNIRELGLLCADGTLFARKVRGLIEKTSDLSITGSWTIIFKEPSWQTCKQTCGLMASINSKLPTQ